MRYLNQKDIQQIGYNWGDLINEIRDTVLIEKMGQISQPIKPYLRFGDPINRIIAMPAYVGGEIDMAGIKWIASFPHNIEKNIKRANSVTILNNSQTGIVESIINTAEVSKIRTCAVSGLLLQQYLKHLKHKVKVLIIGFGPIGQMHYKMLRDHFSKDIESINIFDIRKIENCEINDKDKILTDWRSEFKNADIVFTCTVSNERYIDIKPKNNCLLLNVSLRDYKLEMFDYVKDNIIVDNWEEVNRENTDIENFYKHKNLKETDVKTLYDAIQNEFFKHGVYFFCPMGMAIFDIAIASYYYRKSIKLNIGIEI